MLNKASAHLHTLGNNILFVIIIIYLFIANSSNIRKRCEICSKLRIKKPDGRSTVFIVHFEHISHFILVFVLSLNKCLLSPTLSIKKNVEITYCWNYQQMYKNFSEMAAHKKGFRTEVFVPKKHFFFLVYCI